MRVNRHYQWNRERAEEEGLEEIKGPQSFEDAKNNSLLHYYGGNGWYKWYR